MTRAVTIDFEGLRAALGESLTLDGATLAEVRGHIADAAIEWTIKLKGPAIVAPGQGLWPVGNIENLGQSDERYLASNDSRGRSSGRSLGAWDVDQRDLTLVATNTAVDAKRNPYAEFVHFAGDPTGQAVDDAWDAFVDLFGRKAARKIADTIGRALLR